MPSFGDTALIALLALLLFGPKKLPELARQLGKLMGEFRRASNEFRMQMEDELRVSEQEEQRKKIAAMEAAAPAAPVMLLQDESLVADHPHLPPVENTIAIPAQATAEAQKPERHTATLPIATAGHLSMMPPSTGLPVSRSPLGPVLESIPHADPETITLAEHAPETTLHG